MKFKKASSVFLSLAMAFAISTSGNVFASENSSPINTYESTDGVITRALKTYTHTNKVLAPISAKFTVAIDSVKKPDGTYAWGNKTYQTPVVTNSGKSSFQVSSTSASMIDGGRHWCVSASGTYVEDGVNMGTTSIAAIFYLNSTTGAITSTSY